MAAAAEREAKRKADEDPSAAGAPKRGRPARSHQATLPDGIAATDGTAFQRGLVQHGTLDIATRRGCPASDKANYVRGVSLVAHWPSAHVRDATTAAAHPFQLDDRSVVCMSREVLMSDRESMVHLQHVRKWRVAGIARTNYTMVYLLPLMTDARGRILFPAEVLLIRPGSGQLSPVHQRGDKTDRGPRCSRVPVALRDIAFVFTQRLPIGSPSCEAFLRSAPAASSVAARAVAAAAAGAAAAADDDGSSDASSAVKSEAGTDSSGGSDGDSNDSGADRVRVRRRKKKVKRRCHGTAGGSASLHHAAGRAQGITETIKAQADKDRDVVDTALAQQDAERAERMGGFLSTRAKPGTAPIWSPCGAGKGGGTAGPSAAAAAGAGGGGGEAARTAAPAAAAAKADAVGGGGTGGDGEDGFDQNWPKDVVPTMTNARAIKIARILQKGGWESSDDVSISLERRTVSDLVAELPDVKKELRPAEYDALLNLLERIRAGCSASAQQGVQTGKVVR